MALIFMMTIIIGNENVFAETKKVSDFAGLKAAITDASVTEITVSGEIVATETLEVNRNIKISGGTIKAGSALISSLANNTETYRRSGNIFYVESGKSLTLKDITLDGNKQARIIFTEGGTIDLTNAILQNGTTENFRKIEKAGKDEQNYSGGAILATLGSTVDVTSGKFIDNNTGSKYLDAKRSAEGGAIKIDSSKLNIDGTSFTGNHLDSSKDEGGRQGGAIEATNTVAVINRAKFNIPGPFNTGGAIKFENCSSAKVTDSTFTIAGGKGEFGIAGGAITSEGSNLKIEKSNFKAGKGTRVAEAGGLIQVLGKGSFTLSGSTLEGSGAWFNGGKDGLYTANTGGAISFYNGCEMTAKITDTTIKNFMADGNGAGIALSKGNGHSSSVNLTLKNTTIENSAAYTYENSYAGGLYVGKGNTVKIEGGKISNPTASFVVSGIYNMGDLEITGGAQIIGNYAYKMVGGIYNGGKLKIDDATISNNNVGDWSTGDKHILDKTELGGKNIYANENFTITSKAKFDGNDVRVFNEQSAILLAGSPNKINVSISEKPKTNKPGEERSQVIIFAESQHRKVGYVVAKGEGYEPTYLDARKLNYVTEDKSQAVAGPDDHESTGTWDYVLNPKTKNIVLGQRVKVTLYANGTTEAPAKFEGVTEERNEDEGILTKLPSEDKKEDIYDIYTEGEKSAILLPVPVRQGYAFTGWYKEAAVNDDAPDENKSGKTQVKDLKLVKDANEITTIIDPHEHELYAGWEKIIPVKKVWDDENDKYGNRPDSVTVKLFLNGQDLNNSVTLNAENNWKGEFKNLPESEEDIILYSVKEVPEKITGYEAGTVAGNDKDGFTVTNKTEFITIEGSKTWKHGTNPKDKQPTSVTVKLSDGTKEESKTVGANDNWTWKFEKLPKYKNKTLVNYNLTETPVENYNSVKSEDGYSFTNTYTDKYKVHYVFVAKETDKPLPEAINEFKPTDDKEYKDGETVSAGQPTQTSFEDTTNDGTWTFDSWDKQSDKVNKADVTFTGYWTFKEKTSDFSITKTVDKATYEKVGEVLNYTVVVKNTGEKDLTGLTISDDKTTFDNPTFDLKKGESKELKYTYIITEADVTAKSITNTAKVKLGDKERKDTTTSTLVEKKSGFYITKTVNKAMYEKIGDVLTYKVTVKNTGEKKLEKLTISDTKVTLNEDPFNLEVDASQEFTYSYTVTEDDVKAKKVINVATVTHGKDEKSAEAISKLKENKPEPQPNPEPTPQPPIIPEKPGFNPFWPIYFGSQEKYEVSEKVELNKEDHKAYMFGYPNWDFRPNSNMTRAEVTAMFARLLKNYPSTDVKYNLPYSDVFEGDWYYPAVGFMTENNIVKGYEDGTFRPNSPVTRAEFATIASKFEELIGDNVKGFSDVPTTHWALRFINSAYARGWVTGYEDGTFRPNRNITRAEVVTVTNKMLIRYADKEFVRANKGIMLHFKDLDESHWAYFNIMEATHGHDYSRRSNKLDEIWYRLNGEAFIFPDLKYYDK